MNEQQHQQIVILANKIKHKMLDESDRDYSLTMDSMALIIARSEITGQVSTNFRQTTKE